MRWTFLQEARDREEDASSGSDGELDVEGKAARLSELLRSGNGSNSGTELAGSGAVPCAKRKTEAGPSAELGPDGGDGADEAELPDDVLDGFVFRNAAARAPAALQAVHMKGEVQAPSGGAAASIGPAVPQQRGAGAGPSQGTASRRAHLTGRPAVPSDAAVLSTAAGQGEEPSLMRPPASTGGSCPYHPQALPFCSASASSTTAVAIAAGNCSDLAISLCFSSTKALAINIAFQVVLLLLLLLLALMRLAVSRAPARLVFGSGA